MQPERREPALLQTQAVKLICVSTIRLPIQNTAFLAFQEASLIKIQNSLVPRTSLSCLTLWLHSYNILFNGSLLLLGVKLCHTPK